MMLNKHRYIPELPAKMSLMLFFETNFYTFSQFTNLKILIVSYFLFQYFLYNIIKNNLYEMNLYFNNGNYI